MLRIGTSGWQYRDWRDRFYPRRLAASRWLEYYATRFDTVEVNNTFYRLPAPKTFADWAYVRFHFGRAQPSSCYGIRSLKAWMERLSELFGRDPDGYVYFNNDAHGCAVRDAARFIRLAPASSAAPRGKNKGTSSGRSSWPDRSGPVP